MFDPILILATLVITAFGAFQIWNIINSFKTGKIYDLGRKPLWSIDKNGKQHPITQVDKKENPTNFTMASVLAWIILIMTVFVWLICIAVMFS